MGTIEGEVLNFLKKELFEEYGYDPNSITLDTSISTGEFSLVAEDADETLFKFSQQFNVTFKALDFRQYFPQTGIIFLPNSILPDYMKTDHHHAAPLTINMLVDVAKCGYWRF